MITASAVPRLLACPASAVLPQREYQSAAADAGTARHLDRETAVDLRDLSKLPRDVAAMIRPSDQLLTEHVFSYDVSTGEARHHGVVPREKYGDLGLGPFEFPGKIDLLILGTDRAIVVDYKGFKLVADASENGQTLSYALMVARVYRVEVTVVIAYELRRPNIADLGDLDLDAHAERLKRMYGDVARAQRDPGRFLATGPHCEFCPAFHDCPRQRDLQLRIATGETRALVEAAVFSDDEEAQWALDLLGEIKLIQTRIHAALAARAAERPIPLRSGKMYGPQAKLGNRKIDGDIAYEVVKKRHGSTIAGLAAPRVATQKALKEALEFVDGDAKEMLAEIDAAGGVKRDPRIEIEEYTPTLRLVQGSES